MEKTLSIIKPDAVRKGHIDEICKRIEDSGLNILEKKKMDLTQEEAEGFYIEHKGKPFFDALIEFMTSGTIQVQVLEGEDAIIRYRDLMGSTSPGLKKDKDKHHEKEDKLEYGLNKWEIASYKCDLVAFDKEYTKF